MVTQSVLTRYRVPDYSNVKPLPDPPRQPDLMEQYPAITAFTETVGPWFRHRDDVFVGALGYLWATPDDRTGPYPDGTFADELDGPERLAYRNGYVISEIGKPPAKPPKPASPRWNPRSDDCAANNPPPAKPRPPHKHPVNRPTPSRARAGVRGSNLLLPPNSRPWALDTPIVFLRVLRGNNPSCPSPQSDKSQFKPRYSLHTLVI